MMLIIGPTASGKRDYLRSLGYAEEAVADGELSALPVLDNLQELVRRDPASSAALLPALLKKEVVLCDEVGYGVVPVDPEERAYREAVGRLCCELARHAKRVVRVICGLPTLLKDERKGASCG